MNNKRRAGRGKNEFVLFHSEKNLHITTVSLDELTCQIQC